MVKKKHCDKHYRYVATCPDCKALNENEKNKEKSTTYYQDVRQTDEEADYGKENIGPEIPNLEDSDRSPPNRDRFHYKRPISPDRRKKIIISGIIGGVIILILVLYVIPLWYARINLQEQLYDKKSGINFWKIYSLNYWSTSFLFNKIGLIGAIIGCLVMTLPPETDLITLLGNQFNWGRPSKKKAILIWWTAGFILFFLVGQAIETGYFGLTMLMINEGKIHATFGTYFRALGAIFNPTDLSPVDLFVYSNITRPIIIYILILIIIRIIIKASYTVLVEKNKIKPIAYGSFIIAIFFFISLTKRPKIAQNAIDLIRVWSIILGFLAFLGIGIGMIIYAKKQEKFGYLDFPNQIQKTAVITAVALIFIILLPVFISIPKNVRSGNDLDTYQDLIWDVQYSKQLAWTRGAAGIEIGGTKIFQTQSIADYPENVISTDSDILNVIRQYDKEITAKQMQKSIKSSREDMADSDIVYIKEGAGAGEYWVAPKTLPIDLITKSTENLHTELVDYVNGYIAIDTSTGQQVDPEDYETIFGVDSDYPIFFGEKADTSYTDTSNSLGDTSLNSIQAYENDILLYTSWRDQKNITYDASPDGTLSGLQGMLFTLNMGLYTQAFEGGEKSFLINRNIRERVESILLPGMELDSDPYLIFNREEGKLFYGLSVYTDLVIGSYADSPLYRFLGTVLIDVSTGELIWYRSPQKTGLAQDDLFGELWDIFVDPDFFPWVSDIPDWLSSQLRYPEELWEKQLDVDYIYHVTDAITWRQGSSFFEQPANSDIYYVESDLSEGLEFVGTAFVEYDAIGAEKLAGVYMVRHGNHFGEVVFYSAGSGDDPDLIGPSTAKDQINSLASQDYPPNSTPRLGNTILYPIADSLYYYIPIYTEGQNSELENLIITGFVNAFDKTTYFGSSLQIAYTKLLEDTQVNDTEGPTNTTSTFDLTIDGPDEVSYDENTPAEIDILLQYPVLNNTGARNITMNMTVYSSTAMDVLLYDQALDGYLFDREFNDGYNYTIKVWNDENALYPSDIRGFTLKMNPQDQLNATILAITYQINLIDMDSGEIFSSDIYILTFLNY